MNPPEKGTLNLTRLATVTEGDRNFAIMVLEKFQAQVVVELDRIDQAARGNEVDILRRGAPHVKEHGCLCRRCTRSP